MHRLTDAFLMNLPVDLALVIIGGIVKVDALFIPTRIQNFDHTVCTRPTILTIDQVRQPRHDPSSF